MRYSPRFGSCPACGKPLDCDEKFRCSCDDEAMDWWYDHSEFFRYWETHHREVEDSVMGVMERFSNC